MNINEFNNKQSNGILLTTNSNYGKMGTIFLKPLIKCNFP